MGFGSRAIWLFNVETECFIKSNVSIPEGYRSALIVHMDNEERDKKIVSGLVRSYFEKYSKDLCKIIASYYCNEYIYLICEAYHEQKDNRDRKQVSKDAIKRINVMELLPTLLNALE